MDVRSLVVWLEKSDDFTGSFAAVENIIECGVQPGVPGVPAAAVIEAVKVVPFSISRVGVVDGAVHLALFENFSLQVVAVVAENCARHTQELLAIDDVLAVLRKTSEVFVSSASSLEEAMIGMKVSETPAITTTESTSKSEQSPPVA